MSGNFYIDIWEDTLPYIIQGLDLAINKNKTMEFQLNIYDFLAVGDRESYTFTLKYDNGTTKRNGTAVGRDLQEVLKDSREFREFAKGKFIKLHLTRQFITEVSATKLP